MHYRNYHQPLKLLILYASYGEGHLQAARALREALERYDHISVTMYDLMAESHPWLNEMTRLFYLKSYTHMPALYGWMYERTKPMKHDSLFGSWLHSFGRHKISQLLRSERPDAVIHTFPMYTLPELERRRKYRIPSYAVITDFDLHCRWVHSSIQRYYVATNDLKTELRLHGIPNKRICVSGIPLKQSFRIAAATPELYSRYGLHPQMPTVLIMAGAQGVMPDVAAICDCLLEHSGLQVALVCGRNSLLQASVKQRFASHPAASRLHLFGFIEQIHELMGLADCLVTKPGGVTLAEAIAAELPTFIYRPVPGQEKQNALYLQTKGASFIAYHPEGLAAQIVEQINDPMRLNICRMRIRRLQAAKTANGSPTAAESIILDILAHLGIMESTSTL